MTRALCLILLLAVCLSPVFAQTAAPTNRGNAVVPAVVNFSGSLVDANGKAITAIAGVTFSLYKDQHGGSPLWMETQNIQPDKNGRYTVLLGSGTSQGLPAGLFTSGEARWLSIQAQGQPEQPRVMLLSVPYALKAADAETVGGLPPAAFVLAPAGAAGVSTGNAPARSISPNIGGVGTERFVPLWIDNDGNLGDSAIFQSGTAPAAKIGINTQSPVAGLDVTGGGIVRGPFNVQGLLLLPSLGNASPTKGFNSESLNLTASVFDSNAGKAVAQTFEWQAEPTGNNSGNAAATLNLLAGSGVGAPSETGLKISNAGVLNFVSGQTYPGTAMLNASNTFTRNQSINGNVSATQLISTATQGMAPFQVSSTTQVANLNASMLGGLPPAAYANLGSNTFLGSQAINGNLTVGGNTTLGAVSGADLTTTSNAVNVLCYQKSAAAISGNNSDENLFSPCTIPSSALVGANGFRVILSFLHSKGSAVVAYKLMVNGSPLSTLCDNALTTEEHVELTFMNDPGSQASNAVVSNCGVGNVVNQLFLTTTVNTASGSIILTPTFNVGSSDQVSPHFFLVELMH